MRLRVEDDAAWWSAVGSLARELDTPLLCGAIGMAQHRDGAESPINAAYLLDRAGALVQRWGKMTLVPPAETLPFLDRVPSLRRAVGGLLQRRFGFHPFSFRVNRA